MGCVLYDVRIRIFTYMCLLHTFQTPIISYSRTTTTSAADTVIAIPEYKPFLAALIYLLYSWCYHALPVSDLMRFDGSVRTSKTAHTQKMNQQQQKKLLKLYRQQTRIPKSAKEKGASFKLCIDYMNHFNVTVPWTFEGGLLISNRLEMVLKYIVIFFVSSIL